MEENVIIVGKPVKRIGLLIVGLILLAAGILCFIFNVWNCHFFEDRYFYYETTFIELVFLDVYEDCQIFVATLIDLGFLMTAGYIAWMHLRRKVAVTVTDKRVYYLSLLGKRTDLPVDFISAVSAGPGKRLCVSTPSGRIRLCGIINNRDVQREISDLIVARQRKN